MVHIAIIIRNSNYIRIIAFSEVSTYLMHCFTLFIHFTYVANAECAITGGPITRKFILLTLKLLMSYIYGAPSKARNANVVYIWTYVWQR